MDLSPSEGVGRKRCGGEEDLGGGVGNKRVKMRDLESVLRSDPGIRDNSENSGKQIGSRDKLDLNKEAETSQTMKETIRAEGSQMVMKRCSFPSAESAAADLVLGLGNAVNDSSNMVHDSKVAGLAETNTSENLPVKADKLQEHKASARHVLGLDLNAVGAPNMTDYNPFHPYKKLDQLRATEPSECGSTTGPPENDSLRMWNEMKQNGFVSLSRGGIPLPSKRGRKSKKRKEEELKKKVEIAQNKQSDRLAKAVAPSGLLSGLNPGIINHVRNSKQVRSIIETIIMSETLERPKGNQSNKESIETLEASASELRPSLNRPDFFHKSQYKEGMQLDGGVSHESNLASCFTSQHEDDPLTLKLVSGGAGQSETASQTSNDDTSASKEIISSLSVKGANVAFQWLELLHQDVKGRLAALRRSRKRVRNAIQSQLPYLLSKGDISKEENITCLPQSSIDDATSDMHMVRWKVLFGEMDKELSEEGKHLEIWLEQVKEMLFQCERGLKCVNSDGMPFAGLSDTRSNSVETSEKGSAVRAAAASIYSTCTFAMSKENVPCF